MRPIDDDIDIWRKTVVVSGGFAPLHSGHVRYINHAAAYGQVIVVLNSDQWLQKHKGFVFQTFFERMEVVFSINRVASVVAAEDDDGTICSNLEKLQPDIYCVGATHEDAASTAEVELCEKLGIKVIFGVGGPRVQSTMALINAIKEK
jgi:D-beta-D-heptose 7-phosphate kinase/D-beta-D-heptose 1-phosphate adenosyltransferase